MEPVEVREQQVAAGAPATQVAPAAPVAGAAYGTHSTRTVYPVAYRAIQLVWFIVGVINVILALDFIFRLLKANSTGFVDAIYSLGGALAGPFDGIFGDTITRTSYTARWADLVAIAIYSLIGYGITKLIRIATARNAAAPPAAY
ncbi:MAG: hypothetical protein LC721_05915 [Actinobacteria bacterium]|nr:hypothetical protein [Actinomycetota bacterium]